MYLIKIRLNGRGAKKTDFRFNFTFIVKTCLISTEIKVVGLPGMQFTYSTEETNESRSKHWFTDLIFMLDV